MITDAIRAELDQLSRWTVGDGGCRMSLCNGIVVTSPMGEEILYVDQPALSALGYTEDELLGSNLYRLLPRGMRERHPEIMESRANSTFSSDMATRSIVAVHRNGSLVEMNAVVHYMGKLRGVFFITPHERMAVVRRLLDSSV